MYSQFQENTLLGTGLICSATEEKLSQTQAGLIYESNDFHQADKSQVSEIVGGEEGCQLIGFIKENSYIENIRFEIWDNAVCSEGMMIWCKVGKKKIYYQVTSGQSYEETLGSDRHGYQVAYAAQLGEVSSKGFKRFSWLPSMNTPVFLEKDEFGDNLFSYEDEAFYFGNIPNSKIEIKGNINNSFRYHTAILGVTGTGKTQLAFSILRNLIKNNKKVLCIDITDTFSDSLSDLSPSALSLSDALLSKLSEKLFDVETGKFGAPDEKKELYYQTKLACNVKQMLLRETLMKKLIPIPRRQLIRFYKYKNQK